MTTPALARVIDEAEADMLLSGLAGRNIAAAVNGFGTIVVCMAVAALGFLIAAAVAR